MRILLNRAGLGRWALFGLSLGAAIWSHAAPADVLRIRPAVDSVIRPLLEAHRIPGMAVAVTIGGERYFFNYGVASLETDRPVDENTIFEIGSVSKMYTSTLATYACELGALSLDDSPSQYIPELKGTATDRAQLLHLGTYTSGGFPLQFPDAFDEEKQMIPYFQQWQPESAPGLRRRYSNPSIGLLGRITAVALKSSFADAVEGQLLPRLGLTDTYVRVPEQAKARYAWGYNSADKPIRVNPGLFDAEAYGIKTTAADLIEFVEVNIDPTKIESSLQRAIVHTQLGYYKVGVMVQGLGWEQYPYPTDLDTLLAGNSTTMAWESNAASLLSPPLQAAGAAWFNKTGSTNGFGAYVAFVPARKIGIVMLANRYYPNSARIKAAYEIFKAIEAQRL